MLRTTHAILIPFLFLGCSLAPLRTPPPVCLPQPDPQAALPLEEKAALFEIALDEVHLEPWGGLAYRVRLPEGPDGPRRVWYQADQACWTGTLLGAQCERWAATGDGAALDRVRTLLQGLTVLSGVTGERGHYARYVRPPGRVERENDATRATPAADPWDGYKWRGDLSKDQLSGLLYGLCAVDDLIEDPWCRARAARLLSDLADRVRSRGYRIEEGGVPTTFGDLSPRVAGFPVAVHGAALLALARSAWHATGEPRHRRFLESLGDDAVPATLRVPTLRVAGKENWNNPNMVALSVASVLRRPPGDDAPRAERDFHREAVRAMERILDLHRGEGNAFWIAVAAPAFLDPRDGADARRALGAFPVRRVDEPVDHRGREDLAASWWTSRRGRPQSTTPLPVEEMSSGSFVWKSDPFESLQEAEGDGLTRYSGVDYLAAYWPLRRLGLVE